MNQIRLELIIDRSNSTQRLIQYFRHGHGDDMVEHAADYLERVLENGVQELIEKSGGEWTKPPVPTEFTIKVNAATKSVIPRREISYDEVVRLAGKQPGRVWTITYIHRLTGVSGILSPGQNAPLMDGMLFNVCDTSNA